MTWTCWAVVDDKEILNIGIGENAAIARYLIDYNHTLKKPWAWHVEKYGVRVVKLECKEVE